MRFDQARVNGGSNYDSLGMEGALNKPVKERFLELALLKENGAFQKGFDTWFKKIPLVTNGVPVLKEGPCKTIADGSLKKDSRLYITKGQLKLKEWCEVYFSAGKELIKEPMRMKVQQFMLLGTKPEQLRMVFYGKHPIIIFTDGSRDGYDASHLCHNEECLHPDHLVADPYWVNREARKACPGPRDCHCYRLDNRGEFPENVCRIPGPEYAKWNSR